MYFITQKHGVYHVLSDESTGEAPCGARLSNLDVFCLAEGKPTPNVVEERPEDAPFCKHCERLEED